MVAPAMILGDPQAGHIQTSVQVTLDDLFRRAVARRPDAMALCDPPNRSSFTDGEPRRLTYAQADHIVSAIAGRLRRLGLLSDSVVGLQLPNTVESVLTLLGVLRAGLIAVPMPMLWRRIDAAEALNRAGAKAIITSARIGATDHCNLARDIAAEVFPVRYVCSFGTDPPDGVIPLDDLLAAAPLLDPPVTVERDGNAAAHVAVVTFEVTPDGLMAVARNHAELIAGGHAVRLEAQLQDDATILASCAGSSFAGLASSVVPWLLTGGTLSLHQPFDDATFADQCRDDHCDTVVVPGPLAARISQAGLLTHDELKTIVALWRAPERLNIGSAWRHSKAATIDVQAFSETALIAARRSAAGQPAEIPLGQILCPRNQPDAEAILETSVTESGTLAVRGAMVPRHPFPPGAERTSMRCFMPDALGFAETGYPCRADRNSAELTVTGPPPGLVGVGGYRFKIDQLHGMVERASPDAIFAALPDALGGHRLAGTALERGPLRRALDGLGVNPLVSAAFGERRRVHPN
jgi:non-ribosomal peptide synthetase component E (peptide arylation enzyme)